MTQCFTDWGNEYLFLDIGCHSGYYPTLFKNYFKKIDIDNFYYHQYFVGNENITVL